jgi:hypothetical protein
MADQAVACLQHFVDKYNLLYVYPVNGSQHVRSGGQMGGTVHDLVLFSLCLMQCVTHTRARTHAHASLTVPIRGLFLVDPDPAALSIAAQAWNGCVL